MHKALYAPQRITGFHRIRHYGLIANTTRKANLARARELLMSSKPEEATDAETNPAATAEGRDEPATYLCPDCGAPMLIMETFLGGQQPRAPPSRIGES